MENREQKMLVEREENINTQRALDAYEEAQRAGSYAGRSVPKGAKAEHDVSAKDAKKVHDLAAAARAESLYDMVMRYFRTLNARLKAPYEDHVALYKKAEITGSVWSDLKAGKIPKEDTLFKLMLGLQLGVSDAEALLRKAGIDGFLKNPKHQFIAECLRTKTYDKETVMERMEARRLEIAEKIIKYESPYTDSDYFDNIFDERDVSAQKRAAFKQKLKEARPKKKKMEPDERFEARYALFMEEMEKIADSDAAQRLGKKIEQEIRWLITRQSTVRENGAKIREQVESEKEKMNDLVAQHGRMQAQKKQLQALLKRLLEQYPKIVIKGSTAK